MAYTKVPKVCEFCEAGYMARKPSQRFCSNRCKARLRRLPIAVGDFALVPLTHGKFAVIDVEDIGKVSGYTWSFSRWGYATTNKRGPNGEHMGLRMHRLILGLTDESVHSDHIDGNRLNNRKQNLRPCTIAENNLNRGVRKESKSQLKGVYFEERRNLWKAHGAKNGKQTHIGYFKTREEAVAARNVYVMENHGEFGVLTPFPSTMRANA